MQALEREGKSDSLLVLRMPSESMDDLEPWDMWHSMQPKTCVNHAPAPSPMAHADPLFQRANLPGEQDSNREG